jgi:tripartite-type tricarboxylate transporter receptor subunit TctC
MIATAFEQPVSGRAMGGEKMTTILRFLSAALLVAWLHPAGAQTYPSQPIKLIAPFPPGGSVDITGRLIAEPLGAQLGTRVVIENRTGASGNIGMEAAARAAPDGYTVVLNTIPLVTNQSLFEKLSWDPLKDFAPIGMVATSPHVLVVPTKVPAASVAELLRLARASPGKLSYASAGVGTTFHLCAEMFKDSTGTFILHVPYRGGGPALQDTLGGQVDMSFPTLAAALPHVKAGTLRALAVTDTKRSPLLPDVPTLQEAGVKDAQFTQWLALLAPAGTPPAVVERLNVALRNALNTKEVQEKFAANAFEPFITTPDEAAKFIASEATRFTKLIKARKITAN